MLDWLNSNKEWFLSGLGITVLTGAVWLLRRVFSRPGDGAAQYQRSGAFSKNTQIGSINVGKNKDEP
jgi:hypothetical protein